MPVQQISKAEYIIKMESEGKDMTHMRHARDLYYNKLCDEGYASEDITELMQKYDAYPMQQQVGRPSTYDEIDEHKNGVRWGDLFLKSHADMLLVVDDADLHIATPAGLGAPLDVRDPVGLSLIHI